MSYLFLDTEFTDFTNMDLISIGLVSEDGTQEFYREVSNHIADFRSDFVRQVVIPLLDGGAVSKSYDHVAYDLQQWFDQLPWDTVTIVVDYTGDAQLIDKLLKKSPTQKRIHFKMLNQGFLHMLHERGCHTQDRITPAYAALMNETNNYFLQDPRQHHALVDAKANRHGWLAGYKAASK